MRVHPHANEGQDHHAQGFKLVGILTVFLARNISGEIIVTTPLQRGR